MSAGQATTVLFATIAAGGGHVATANAMADAVASASDGRLSTRVSDAMAEFGPVWLDRRHKASWRDLLARPRLVRLGQRLTDAVPAATRLSQDVLLAGFARRVTAALDRDPPALVVANHGWLATAFTLARRRYGLRTRVVVYATEPFDASALWSTPHAEVVLAPSAAARSALMRVGVPADRVLVAGYPVAERFLTAPSRDVARASLGLGAGFTCLVTLGAEGVAGDAALQAVIALAEAGVNVLVVAGRNHALQARFETAALQHAERQAAHHQAPQGQGHRTGTIAVFGFVSDMERLLAAADLVVGKAGPASTMEALAVGRPVLATAYAGLNELAVTRFLERRGVGAYVGGWSALPAAVAAWRSSPRRVAAAQHAAERLDFGAMTRGIGSFLVAHALTGQSRSAQAAPERARAGATAPAAGATAEAAGAAAAVARDAAAADAGVTGADQGVPAAVAALLRPGAFAAVTAADVAAGVAPVGTPGTS